MITVHPNFPLSPEELHAYCEKWQITEFALFGSATRSDFHAGSDLDVMVEFSPRACLGLWDLARAQGELEDLVGRRVDLVEKGTVRNPYRRKSINRDLIVVYAA